MAYGLVPPMYNHPGQYTSLPDALDVERLVVPEDAGDILSDVGAYRRPDRLLHHRIEIKTVGDVSSPRSVGLRHHRDQ